MESIPDGIGGAWLQLTKDERMVAYLALKVKGKVKGRDLGIADRVRSAVLADCDIDQETGRVTWVSGIVALRDAEEVRFLAKGLDKLVGDDGEGVDIDMAGAAASLQAKVEDKQAELKVAAKEATPTA